MGNLGRAGYGATAVCTFCLAPSHSEEFTGRNVAIRAYALKVCVQSDDLRRRMKHVMSVHSLTRHSTGNPRRL